MADRSFLLKWAHLTRGRRISDPRIREIIEAERRAFNAHVAEIQAEQEQCNTELAARMAGVGGRRLMVAPRYAKRSR